MYKYTVGNILTAEAEAIVNTVNTYGVMGKGIALAFKKSFPNNYRVYRHAFDNGELAIGRMVVVATGQLMPRYIINFPTKKHWRHKSQMSYLEEGLEDLLKVIRKEKISSIAIPPLGCGNGGLDWNEVRPLIEEKLNSIKSTVDVIFYEPGFSIPNMRSVKSLTSLNPTRAIYLHIIRQYELLGEEITTLVVQKLAYLLQLIGENLNLRFNKGYYGPYSSNLNKMLEALSPNYLIYNGDLNKPGTVVQLVQDKKQEAQEIINTQLNYEQQSRLDSILNFIDGFENAFGLELLATVAYAMQECPACEKHEIIENIQNWTTRKRELMSEHMISVSYDRVKEFSDQYQLTS